MNKYNRSLITAFGASLLISFAAQAELTKTQAKEQAIETCQNEAKSRYGESSIKSVGKKAKWVKDLKGASINLKIKPKSKRASKYSCVLGLDNSVTFYKA